MSLHRAARGAVASAVAAIGVALAGGSLTAVAEPTPPPYVPPPYVAPTPDPNFVGYDDRSIHFVAPSGWKRVDQGGGNDINSPVVAFLEDKKYDAASIGIAVARASVTLDRFDDEHESQIRSAEGYIEHRSRERLANGMPAYFVQSSAGEGTSSTRRFEWLVVDGEREILVTEVARKGVLDEATARRDLSTLSVVVYPGSS